MASYGNILEDIRQLVGSFQSVIFSHTSGVCNSVVDALAKKAKLVVGDQFWLGDLPTDLPCLCIVTFIKFFSSLNKAQAYGLVSQKKKKKKKHFSLS